MSTKHTPGPSGHTTARLRGESANASIAKASRADARARAELRLSEAQLSYLRTAQDGSVQDWAAPSMATLRVLLDKGFLSPTPGIPSAGAANFYRLTDKAFAAIAKATGGVAQ